MLPELTPSAHAVRCIGCDGSGAASAVIAGLDWVAANVKLPAVVSMSLGATGLDTTMDAAVQAIIALGVTVVAAAGNYNNGAPSGEERRGKERDPPRAGAAAGSCTAEGHICLHQSQPVRAASPPSPHAQARQSVPGLQMPAR